MFRRNAECIQGRSFGRLFFVVFLSIGFFLSFSPVSAATGNTEGFAWGGGVEPNPSGYEGIGWISMSSSDCDTNDDGRIDNAACGIVGTPIASYGVTLPSTDGDLSGYAWSEHYGWISFNASDVAGCPSSGTCQARRSGDNILGWARILSIRDAGLNSGGWSGWISLNDANFGGNNYGLLVSKMNKVAPPSGTPTYAYSDELGWIDFSYSGFQSTLKICEGSAPRNSSIHIPLSSGATTTLTAKYGTGNCSTDPLVNASWVETNAPDNAVSLSAIAPAVLTSAKTVTVTAGSIVGTPSAHEDLSATYLGKTETTRADVTCAAQSCANFSAQTNTYCPTESQSFDNLCGGTVSCSGTRSCNYNWKEAQP